MTRSEACNLIAQGAIVECHSNEECRQVLIALNEMGFPVSSYSWESHVLGDKSAYLNPGFDEAMEKIACWLHADGIVHPTISCADFLAACEQDDAPDVPAEAFMSDFLSLLGAS